MCVCVFSILIITTTNTKTQTGSRQQFLHAQAQAQLFLSSPVASSAGRVSTAFSSTVPRDWWQPLALVRPYTPLDISTYSLPPTPTGMDGSGVEATNDAAALSSYLQQLHAAQLGKAQECTRALLEVGDASVAAHFLSIMRQASVYIYVYVCAMLGLFASLPSHFQSSNHHTPK